MGSIGQGREIDGSRLAGTDSTTFILIFRFRHLLAPPPAARERPINECCDKAVLWNGKSTKSHLKRIGGGRGSSDAELEILF